MDYWQAIFLGIVQGLTEFLPVSSSGHLVAFQSWLACDPCDPATMLFNLMVHVGTVVAIVYYYRRPVVRYLVGLKAAAGRWNEPISLYRDSPLVRVTVYALLATCVTGGLYILAGDRIESSFDSMTSVAICWGVTGTMLLITDRQGFVSGSLKDLSIVAALAIGLAQGAALLPGISRSGSTICVAVLFGLRREWAGQFSFLIGVPAILGATLIKTVQFVKAGHTLPALGPMFAGAISAAVVGLAALTLLIWALRRAKLKVFAVYCYCAAFLALWVL